MNTNKTGSRRIRNHRSVTEGLHGNVRHDPPDPVRTREQPLPPAGKNENVLIPSARRLVKSLRDMGYDFAAAVADLVDNSIEAGASLIAIDVEFDGDDTWVRIVDDGRGMTLPQLREALRFGAERDYDETDLGKFGLGLKTASLSQCQRLTVASRTNPKRADIHAFCWDLAHIERTNRWEILPVERNGLGPSIRAPLKDTTGTVVLWQRLDRVLGYKLPYGESARKRLSAMCRELETHLGMVFHRFLAGEVEGQELKILVNGNTVVAWDPYARDEPKTTSYDGLPLALEYEGITGEVMLESFVLPPQQGFSTQDAFRRASGPANWNQQQGFYIYRANRLIQSGGWCKLRTVDEHTKLARIAISFMPTLDEAFKINVAKMRVQLPSQIKDQVERAIRPVLKKAQDTYRRAAAGTTHPHSSGGGGAPAASPAEPSPSGGQGNTNLGSTANTPAAAGAERTTAPKMWTLDELQRRLEEVAKPKERPIITKVVGRLRVQIDSAGGSS